MTKMKVGAKFRYPKFTGQLCHVRGYVDGLIVYRTWSRERKRWYYHVIHPAALTVR